MTRSAAIVGATGLVGGELLSLLLEDEMYDKVLVYTRKSTALQHPKMEEKVGDLLDDDFFGDAIIADDIFCAIGTTQAKTPNLAVYRNVDFGIPVRVAALGLKGGAKRFVVVSSMGANANSRIFYPRIKGQMESALQKMPLKRLRIVRPAMLKGKRSEFRLGEFIGIKLLSTAGKIIPKKYRPISARRTALAMLNLAKNDDIQGVIFENDQLRKWAAEPNFSNTPSPNKA